MAAPSAQQQQAIPTDSTIPLLHAAKRVLSLSRLPPYATDLVRAIVREVRERDAIVNQLLAEHSRRRAEEGSAASFDPNDDPEMACRLLVELLGMRRGKRVLLGYHRARVGVVEQRIWDGREDEVLGLAADAAAASPAGGGAADADGDAGLTNLSPEEEDYARRYGEVLAGLKGQWTDIDLTGSLEPPRDLFTDVRVLKDAGVVQTEYGELNLTKNSQFFVRVGDVEGLIRSGYLKRLS